MSEAVEAVRVVDHWSGPGDLDYGPFSALVIGRKADPRDLLADIAAAGSTHWLIVPPAYLRAHDYRLRGHRLEVQLKAAPTSATPSTYFGRRLVRVDGRGLGYHGDTGSLAELSTAAIVGSLALDVAAYLSPDQLIAPDLWTSCRAILAAIAAEWPAAVAAGDDRPKEDVVARRLRRVDGHGKASSGLRADIAALDGWSALTELRPAV